MGKWKGMIGQSFTPEQFREYVAGLSWDDWLPEFIVLHHTAVPSLGQRPSGFTVNTCLDWKSITMMKWGGAPGPIYLLTTM